MADSTVPHSPNAEKKKKDRSPAYPAINLKTALARAAELYAKERRNATPVVVAVKDWGYAEKSSGGIQTIAALKSYGLLSDGGSGPTRKVQLSDLGLRIVMDERLESPERDLLIKKAAITPKIHAMLWKKYGASTVSEESLRHYLRLELKFNDNVVNDFIRIYKDTISFAKLSDSDIVGPEGEGDGEKGTYVPRIGDFVQWESGGVLQFIEPLRVRGTSDDGEYAFVVGSDTGIRVSELIQQKAPVGFQGTPPPDPRNLSSPTNQMKEDVFSLAQGRVVIQWPLGLSADNVQDIKDWLTIVQRKIEKSVVGTDKE
jgi:hypothetical protein